MSAEGVSPMVALRRHKRLTAVLILIGVVAGIGLALIRPTVYTAETRLAVAGGNLTAEAVPGFALAAQQLAANYARYVDNAEEQGALESKLGVRPRTVTDVVASPIPDSNVLRIEISSTDDAAAEKAAAAVAASLIKKVADSAGASDAAAAATLREFTDMATRVADQQVVADTAADAARAAVSASQADLKSLQQAAAEAATQLSILKVQQDALSQKYRNEVSSGTGDAVRLTVVEDAVVTGTDRLARLQQFGLAGAILGALAALLLAVVGERARSRRTDDPGVEVPSTAERWDVAGEPVTSRGRAGAVVGQRAD